METRNNKELPISERHVQGKVKWISPKIVTINTEKAESGVISGTEGVHGKATVDEYSAS